MGAEIAMTDETPRPDGVGAGDGGGFPATRRSAVAAARSTDPVERRRAFERIATVYWKPVYKYIRARWGKAGEDAQELTQEFFTRVIEKDFLAGYDPARARLRTFLRACVDAMIANAERDARRQKRGGGRPILSLDFELAEGELSRTGIPSPDSPEDFFEKEWVRSLFSLAVQRLREECAEKDKEVHFRLFQRYDLDESDGDRPTYADLAREHGLAATDVTNFLAFARREFRRITLETLREMTASENEFRREARALLGVALE